MSNRQSDKSIVGEIKACLDRAARAEQGAEYWKAKAGIRLRDLKKQAGHGHWLPYLKQIGISPQDAGELMRIAKDPGALEKMRERSRISSAKNRAKSKNNKGKLRSRDGSLPYLDDDEDLQGDTPEQQWQFAVANFCGDIIARRAFWTRTFGPDWETFSVPPDLKALLLEAEAAFEIISSSLKKQ